MDDSDWGLTDDDLDNEFGGPIIRRELEKRLVWKVDKRMSILVLIYVLNYIDRNNAGAARLRGFEENLGLEGQQFATALSILYVGYFLMQVPSNMFLNYVGRPSLYLPVCMMLWGVVSVGTGFATNYFDLLLTRFTLGALEASFFPGALFLISKWYKHDELGTRSAIFFCGSIISTTFGSLIASAILDNMDGVLGQAAWRWLFYVEGGLTVLVAFSAMFVLPDFPETTRAGWLTDEEVRLAVRRMEVDAGSGAFTNTYRLRDSALLDGFWLAVVDPHVWILAAALLCQAIAHSFVAWFPTIVATLGHSRGVTLVLCSPPYLLTAISAFFISRHSDRVRERFYHVTIPLWVGVLGFVMAMFTVNTTTKYFALFLVPQAYAGFAVLMGWLSNTFPSPPSKRAVAIALINSVSLVGEIVGSYVWQEDWAPGYHGSFVICAVASCGTILCCYFLKQRLVSANARLHSKDIELESDSDASTPRFQFLV